MKKLDKKGNISLILLFLILIAGFVLYQQGYLHFNLPFGGNNPPTGGLSINNDTNNPEEEEEPPEGAVNTDCINEYCGDGCCGGSETEYNCIDCAWRPCNSNNDCPSGLMCYNNKCSAGFIGQLQI